MICHICAQISGQAENDLLARSFGGQYQRRLVMETPHFAAIPSLGAIVPGHVILCPTSHSHRLADLHASLLEDFEDSKQSLRHRLRETFGGWVHEFEHGSDRAATRRPCTVDHAHLHLLPILHFGPIDLPAELNWIEIDDHPDAVVDVVGGSEYLFYKAPEGRSYVATARTTEIESQLLRRTFAHLVGLDGSWNWRDEPRLTVVDETFRRLTAAG
jgi:diadenosine tetraphosphate (Ap4A) HIT family hydrolase